MIHSVYHDVFEFFSLLFLSLLAFKGMKVNHSLGLLLFISPIRTGFLASSWCIFIQHQFHCKFHCWSKWSVECRNCSLFLILNILIYTSLVYLPLYYWLETSSTVFFFLSFCPFERFLYSVHEYNDIIYSLEKTLLHPGKRVCFFWE